MSPPSSSSSQQTTLRIGIIGFGPFAQFLAKTLMKQGHFISATSRSDYSDLCTNLGILFFSTSILSLSRVVESIPFHCLKRPTLFIDVLSVKEHPKDVLLRILPEECDLLCTHPMFGPESGKDGWTDLTFMYDMVRIRDQHLCSSFLQIFSTEGCKMLEMTCEEHDRLAARSQFLTHTIGRILVEMEVESTPIDTKGFQKLVQVKESSAKDSFDLFSGLFIHNRFARQQMKNLEVAIEKLQERSKELQDPIISKL
ncbi:arogenate dehydrogenase 1, chloroplastic-like isoform X1 [Lycium barbarum]|uniref:arogenate dehydrogenase 1, chloroplastic-like isoform X1 n=1 Tax=Lycium barbarum TaxID=112863 RepID=UPI00293E5123|nr:arogenate dehydrogenase 1, chloroplastic-like isoform X1 [Lycium barbarum]